MKKNNYFFRKCEISGFEKVLRVMKLSIFLLLISVISTFANKTYSQTQSLNLSVKNSTVKEVLQQIEEQSEFYFMYSEELVDVDRRVTIDAKDKKIHTVLDAIFAETNVEYRIRDRFILLTTSEASVGNTSIQQNAVSGTITDENGEPLPGANIIEKGTLNGTQTGYDGSFSLSVSGPDAVLVIRYIGFKEKELPLDGRTHVNIILFEDKETLDEVIVVGYGAQSDRKVSMAASQIDTDELQVDRRPVPNIQSALVGSVPGLITNQLSGQLGQDAEIQVRATSSLESRGALILIDNFEGSISDLAPGEIASVTVLKDAAATAIYGARGANGVVLVTTKRPKRNDQLSVTYNFNYAQQRPSQTAEIVGSELLMNFHNESTLAEAIRNNPGIDPSTVVLPYTQEELARAASGYYPETQWVNELYGDKAGLTSHNIGISGGSEKTGYFINMGYLDQNGLLEGSDNYKRYNLRVNIDTDINDWLTMGTNTSMVFTDLQNVPAIETSNVRGKPFFPVKSEDGLWVDKGAASVGQNSNPVALANSGSYDNTLRDVLNLQVYAKAKVVEGLELEQKVSYVNENHKREIWNTPYPYIFMDLELNQDGPVVEPLAGDRSLELRALRSYRLNSLSTARYKKVINEEHSLNVLLGLQATKEENREQRAGRKNFILDNVQDLSLGLEPLTLDGDEVLGNSSEIYGNRTTLSYFGRLSYDFKGRYLAEASFRNDASSNFGKENQWAFFPSFSLGWNIDDEPFMSDVAFVDRMKLRASWGLVGDDSGGNETAVARAQFNSTGYVLGGAVVPTINLGNAVNTDLTWETSEKINVGIDLSLWNGLFTMNGDYFIDRRKDIITQRQIALESGLITGILDNVYDAKSWGWELQLGHDNTIGDVNIFAGFNLSYYNSEITNTDGTSPLDVTVDNYQDVGLPIFGNWYGYVTDGFFDTQEEMDAHVHTDGNPIDQSSVVTQGDALGRYLGGYKYVDTNEDGVINADDRVVLKQNAVDNYRVGFNVGASYKGFSLSARLYGVLSGYEWWRNGGQYLLPFTGDRAPFVYQTDVWSPDNPNALFSSPSVSNNVPFESNISDLIQKNAYIKLKNINLSYTFDEKVLERLRIISSLQLFVSVENLGVIWTNNPAHDSGWDPELGTGNFRYPLPLTTALGINVSF
ncbi:MAG: TonB-dependent receptor [Carboxylicivirga sp.]|jgi:TonB-linked SusC/RagA family outer membrane protein|nr:TonB-dependent receptor [Carboxylicivirga sp.]